MCDVYGYVFVLAVPPDRPETYPDLIMQGYFAFFIVLGITEFHVQPAAADESDAITDMMAEITKPIALASVPTSRVLQVALEVKYLVAVLVAAAAMFGNVLNIGLDQ